MEEARSLTYRIGFETNAAKAKSEVQEFVSGIGNAAKIGVDADTSRAEAGIGRLAEGIGKLGTEAEGLGEVLEPVVEKTKEFDRDAGSLRQTIGSQESELRKLKQSYVDLASAEDTSSQEARDLAAQIGSLSAELQGNRDRLKNAEDAAEQLGKALEDIDTSPAESETEKLLGSLGKLETEAGTMGHAFRSSFLDGIDSGDRFASSLKSGVGGALSYAGGQVTGFRDRFVQGARDMKEVLTHPIGTIKTGLGNAIQGVKDKFIALAREAENAGDEVDGLGGAGGGARDEIDGLGDSSEEAEEKVKDLGDEAESSGGKFEKFGGILKGIGTGILAAAGAATTAVAAIGGAAIRAGAEYESAFAQVRTIMDTSQMSAEDMSSSIKSLSSEMGIAASELSGTVYNAISATGDTANAVSLAGQASKLATAGFTDTSSALSVLTTAMNAYGLSADEASSISDSLIQVQNLGVTTVSELAANMGKAIASASAYGVNLTNLESAYVSITKAGINTAEGTTYISSMMKELGDSGTDVAKILKENTGKSFDQLMAEGSSLGDVLGILNDSVNGDSTALMNLWSSAEAGKASAAIIGQGLGTFNENLKAIGESAGATESAYNIMADTLEHKTEVFKTAGTNLLSSIYTGMSGELGRVMDFANGAVGQLADAFEEGGVPAVIGALGKVTGEGLDMVTGMLPSLVDTGMQLLGALGQGILDNLPGILNAAMQVVGTLGKGILGGLPTLIGAAGEIIATLASGIGKALPALIPAVTDTLLCVVSTLIDNLPMILDAGRQLLDGLAKGILGAIPLLVEQLPEIIHQTVDFLSDSLPEFLEQGSQILLSLGMGIINAVPQLVEQLPEVISSIVGFLSDSLPGFLEKGSQILLSLGMGIINTIPQMVAQLPEIITSIVGFVTENLPLIVDTGINLIVQLAGGLVQAIPQLVESLPQIIGAIIESFAEVPGMMLDIGKSIVEGIWSGITAMGSWIMEKVSGFFGGIVDGVKDFLGIHSPSTVFAGIGDNMAEGLGKGFGETMDGVAKDMEQSIPTEFGMPSVSAPDLPSVGDMAYKVTPLVEGPEPMAGIHGPAGHNLNAPEYIYDEPKYEDPEDDAPEGDNPYPVTGPDTAPAAGDAPAFSPVIHITVEGNADGKTVEEMKSALREVVRELYQEFREEELERMALKSQYVF